MPSVSKSQARLFAAAAHDKKFAKEVGIDPKVAKEWNEKDKKAKTKDKNLPEHKKKASNETYVTTATLAGPKGFRDQ